jgi:hypothetical protein
LEVGQGEFCTKNNFYVVDMEAMPEGSSSIYNNSIKEIPRLDILERQRSWG